MISRRKYKFFFKLYTRLFNKNSHLKTKKRSIDKMYDIYDDKLFLFQSINLTTK